MRQNPKQKVYVSLAAGVGAALITLIVGYVLFLRSPAPPEAQTHKELLECLVCKRPVDPATTQFKLTYHNQKIYFDRQECLDAFVADPRKYGRVKIEARMDPSASPADDNADTPAPAMSATSGEAEIESSASPEADMPASSSPEACETMVSPEPEDSSAPEATEPAVDDSATRDPNPPPLHKPAADDSASPAACGCNTSASPSSNGDDDVPQPPPGK